MTHGREKRLLLGAMALLAPLPLPLNGVVGWPETVLFLVAVALFLRKAATGSESWLRPWALNLLALAYLPFLWADLTLFWRGRVLGVLVHLAMFVLVVKLFAVAREQDKWHAFLLAFFIALAALGSSVHPAMVLYLAAFVGLSLLAMARFAAYHALAGASARPSPEAVPLGRFVTATTLVALLAAAPLFALLPRLRQPYLVAPGGGSGQVQAAGFADRVELDTIGRVRTGRSVVLRFTREVGGMPGEPRFKAATYDRFTGRNWRRTSRGSLQVRRGREGLLRVADGGVRTWTNIWLKVPGARRLVLPVETVVVDLPLDAVSVSPTGEVSVPRPGPGTLDYRVGLARQAATRWPLAGSREKLEIDLDPTAIGPEIRELALRVMGEGSLAERIGRVERFLINEFEYTLDLGPRGTDRPVERFLFETREGHCEYFATSMVLMLRSQGIPARFVAGYLGAEFNPLEGYYIVRQSNAHAWVEAYLPEEGWRIYDPTPPAGRPTSAESGLGLLLGQAYDYLLFRWDRYVLTYGFFDQADVLMRLRNLVSDLWLRLKGDPGESAAPSANEAEAAATETAPGPPRRSLAERYGWLALLAVVLVAAASLWRARTSWTATAGYRQLRAWAARSGPPVVPSTPPLEIERRLARRHPDAARPAGRLIRGYLDESFAGERLDRERLDTLRRDLAEVRRGLRKSA